MRETITSLKLYFCVVGVLGSYCNLLGLLNSPNIIDVAFTFIKLCVLLAIFYVGCTLKKTLLKSPQLIEILLNLQIILVSLSFLLTLLSRPPIMYVAGAMTGMGVAVLVCLYLLVNVKRLSAELNSRKVGDSRG